jgi:molecular chaperone GrpE
MKQGRTPMDDMRRDDVPADMGAGDASLSSTPPNVEQTQPPSPDITGSAAGGSSAESDTQAEAAALEKDLAAAADRHLRLAAEFDNYRRRVERERAESWSRAQADLARNLLDAIDDLERVAHHAAGEVNYQALLEGVQLVEKKLRSSLNAAGLEFVDAEGAAFDPNTMEAVATVEAATAEEDDTVSDVFQRGYTFKGTLLRPARVRVKKFED